MRNHYSKFKIPNLIIMNSIEKKFKGQVTKQMMEKFGYGNALAVPKIRKVSINVGLSRAAKESTYIEDVRDDLRRISGQAPVFTKARKAIAGFKIREGQNIGLTVTLRGKRMWDFIEKLISATIPRIKDFQGIPATSFDGQGNLSLGIKEHLIFPEISPDDVKTIFGMQINIATNVKNKEEGVQLLKYLGFPIKDN